MSQKKILIVDDEPDMVVWLSSFLEDNGFDTISAKDGFEGFEKAITEKPDLITLDISMDKESGIGMYRKLKENDDTANIPIVMVTGVSPEFKRFIETRKQVPPPDAYFEKPINKEDFLETINSLM